MDFWNRKKVRELENKNKFLQDRLDEFEKRMSGERICGTYCKNCENSFKIGDPNALGFLRRFMGVCSTASARILRNGRGRNDFCSFGANCFLDICVLDTG